METGQPPRAQPREAPAPPPGWAARLTGRARTSPYYPALSHPVLRRILPATAASALGDGMSAVAIAWLALRLAPAGSRGLWVGAAVAAYSLPGAARAVALRRWLHGRGGARLTFINAVLRACALGLIGCLALAGLLGPAGYVALLAASSVLSTWGMAGKYTLIADLLPPAIVLGWGLALVPLGLPGPLWVALAAFFAGAVIWGPWMSLSMAVFQDASPPGALAQVIAARGWLLIVASPLNTALGGPLVAALGARGTLLASAWARSRSA